MDMREELQRTLGSAYTLERELGGGGMSQVFLAEETALGRKVVVKVVPHGRAGDVNIERFKREILVAARLQHAHIVPVLAAGELNGVPYYTMPFVDGESLRGRLLRQGAVPLGETVTILRDVARALAYAHERGVVHRDIKPDNVMIAGGSAVVTDFGIAKAISAARTEAPGATLTQVGTSLGTPAYMAPEQAAGDPATDHRADLYAFGCMAYEMLTGQPPFVEPSLQQLLAAHMARDAEPVTARRPDVPAALAMLIARCLEKDPARRPASAAELTRVLETIGAGTMDARSPFPGGAGMFTKALASYLLGFAVVAVMARAAVSGLGLPDWVFPGAVLVMALGLPAILLTGYVQRVVQRAARATPTFTPGGTHQAATQGTLATLALKAGPHVSWRRTRLGGVYAISGFVLLVGGFMLLRSLGIGPAGSLLAAGKFDAREPILVTDFTVTNADSALGPVLSGATKTTLAHSPVITLLPPEAIAGALARMERPRNSPIDLTLARELANRNAIKAIVDGNITGVASGGYLVRLRLVTADSLTELASFLEPADDTRGLIEAVDRLSRSLRGRIGESLKAVRAAPSLAQVTTGSFEALRKYTEGDRAESIEGNRTRAISLLREAVAADSTFAEAWRRLGVVLRNAGQPVPLSDSAFEAAYRHRQRTSPNERAFIEATYLSFVVRDRARAIGAYEEMLRLGDSSRAANNLAVLLTTRREFARSESLYRASLRANPNNARITTPNLIAPLGHQGKFAEIESLLVDAMPRFPENATVRRTPVLLLYVKGDIPAYRLAVDSVATRGDSLDRTWARARKADLMLLDGRINDFTRFWREREPERRGDARQRLDDLLGILGAIRVDLLEQDSELVRELDAAINSAAAEIRQGDWPYLDIAGRYARGRQPQRARAWLARYDDEVTDTLRRRLEVTDRRLVEAELHLAEERFAEAITAFRDADRLPDGPRNACTYCLPLWLSFAFHEAGMADSAIHYMERVLATPHPSRLADLVDPFVLPIFNERLGKLYEAKGDRAKAVAHYRTVIELWKNADPALQSRVEELRHRIRRLSDIERTGR